MSFLWLKNFAVKEEKYAEAGVLLLAAGQLNNYAPLLTAKLDGVVPQTVAEFIAVIEKADVSLPIGAFINSQLNAYSSLITAELQNAVSNIQVGSYVSALVNAMTSAAAKLQAEAAAL